MRKIFYKLWIPILLFLAVSSFGQSITLLGSTTTNAKGSGTSGNPTAITWDIPAGKSRVMVVTYWFERDHRPVPLSDNYPSGNFGDDAIPPVVGGISMPRKTSYMYTYYNDNSFPSPSMANSQFGTIGQRYVLSEKEGLPTGITTISFPGIATPKNAGDEMIVHIEVFGNVSNATSFINSGGNTWSLNETNTYSYSATNNPVATTIGRTVNEIWHVALAASSKDETFTITPTNWVNITNTRVSNTGGAGGFLSLYAPQNEPDGIRSSTWYTTGNATPPSLTLTRPSNNRIASLRINFYSLLPLAKPSVTGTVYKDTDGNANINGTGTNAGGLYVNAIDTDGKLVYSATVNATGAFTIPIGYVTESETYSLQLSKNTGTIGQTAPLQILPTGWINVGEATSATGNDGFSDGKLNIEIEYSNITGLRFGINESSSCADVHVNPVVFHLFDDTEKNYLDLYKQNGVAGPYVCPTTQCHTNPGGVIAKTTNIPNSYTATNIGYDNGKYYVIDNSGDLLFTDDIIVGNFTNLGNAQTGTGYKNLAVDNGVFYHWHASGTTLTLYSSNDPVNSGWISMGTVNGRSTTYTAGGKTYQLKDIAVHEGVFYFYYYNAALTTVLFSSTNPLSAIPNWQNLGETYYGTDVFNIAIGAQDLKAIAPPVQDLHIVCPSTTIDLATAHTGTTPTGYSLRWFANSSPIGTPLNATQIANAGEGTYYAFYYNNSLNCYSPAAEVNITKENCNLDCVPNLFLSQNGQLYDIKTNTNPFTYPVIGSNYEENYNALGFNPIDGYLYAISNTYQLLKINPNTGAIQNLGGLTNVNTGNPVNTTFLNGDFDENGNYYLKPGNANGMYKVDVTTRLATPILFTPAGNYSSSDFAYNIQDGLLYAVRTITGQGTQLYTINKITGEIIDVGVPHLPGMTFGAMFGDSEGRIFGAANGGGFYQFNLTTGEKTLISDSPTSSNNDGAHCVLSPILFGADPFVTKTNPETSYIPGQSTVYTITVGNNGPFGIMGVGVTDLVPTGIPAANVSYTAAVAGGAATNVTGTQTGAINDVVNLPVGGTVTYTVTVLIPTSFTGDLTNIVNLTISNASSFDTDLTNNTASVTLENEVCFIDPVTTGLGTDTQVGISLIKGRETLQSSDNWPQSRKSGFIALESNKQGMVVTRIAKADLGNIVSPQEGMMVYDTTDKCLKIYSDDEWKCFARPACP